MLYATVRNRKIHVKKPDTVVQNGVKVDWLQLEMDDEWAEMDSIVCVFVARYTEEQTGDGGTKTLVEQEIKKEMLHTFGQKVLVPWEVLVNSGMLSVSCTGYVGSEKIMTTMYPDSFWQIVQNGPKSGDSSIEPTPSLYDQIVAAAGTANAAAMAANQAKDQLLQDKANGVFDGKDGAAAKVSVGSTQTGSDGSEAQVYATGTDQDLKLHFVIPRGKQGIRGETGQTGKTGATGDPGKDGVSPTLEITNITGGYRLTITDATGTKSIDLMNGSDGINGANGMDGVSPILSATSISGGHRITITDAAGQKTVDVMDGEPGSAGKDGSNGADGRGIRKIERTSGTGSSGTSDTYTITYTDNTTSSFTVYNGADGTSFVVKDRYDTLTALKAAHAAGSEGDAYAVGTESENVIYIWGVDTGDWTPIGSLHGPPGTAGVSPTVSVSTITGGHRLTITDAGGTKTVDIMDGTDGLDGGPGEAGQDGVSPTVSISAITGGHRISVTDASGTKSFDVMDGSDGKNGAAGEAGRGVSSISYSAATKKWTVTYTDGSSQELTGPEIPTLLSQLTGDATHRTVTDAEKETWNGKSDFSGSYNDLTNKPSSFTPASHNQAASTVTAGTFAGQVAANSAGQAPGTMLLRNSKLAAASEDPTVNGEIVWVYG